MSVLRLLNKQAQSYKNVAATDEEVECMKRIVAKGVPMDFQLVPAERAINVEKLF